MKVKTSELTGQALDWAVAKCENVQVQYDRMNHWLETPDRRFADIKDPEVFNPSESWAQAGPIIEREWIQLTPDEFHSMWCAFMTNEGVGYEYWGPTPLVAAMRAFVASKLGDEVDAPEEFL